MRALFLVLLLLLVASRGADAKTRILWDTYGVPHIYASDRESMFYAHGWAQMRNQADLLLLLYGQSRGRAAEYWGPEYLELDRWVQTNDVPKRAQEWYQAQDPAFRKYLDAFARGINEFAGRHPELISPRYRVVLPVSGIDVVGHSLRVVHYMYMGSQGELKREIDLLKGTSSLARVAPWQESDERPGSNTWAIGPSRSTSGKAMLIINPHLAWGNTFYRYMEVDLHAPDYELYGAPQIGFPVPVVGFNRRAGWGRTVNTLDTVDFYQLTVRNGKYEFDGQFRPFEQEARTLKVKQPDGTVSEQQLTIRRSVQGPVVYDRNGLTVAMRVVGLDRPKMLQQWFRMGEAQNLQQFQSALRMMAVPMWNANYADADGHIMLAFDGLLPRRNFGDYEYWSKIVPGNTSRTLWSGYHSFEDLPQSIDPRSGFNQNENEAPWFTTLPTLDPSRFPAYVAPSLQFMPTYRTKRSLRMLTEEKSISYDHLLADKHSTRMEAADSVLPDLLKIAAASDDPVIVSATKVLSAWDRQTEADSRGAVLFQLFFDQYFGPAGNINNKLRVKYDPQRYLETDYGISDTVAALAALRSAATECRKIHGSLDVPWGNVFRYGSGHADLPANGGPGRLGVFRTIAFGKEQRGRAYAVHGETFVCAIEFGQPQQAQCLLGYGNATQPDSPHLEDQLPLMVAKKLHAVWRDEREAEKHLELREELDYSTAPRAKAS